MADDLVKVSVQLLNHNNSSESHHCFWRAAVSLYLPPSMSLLGQTLKVRHITKDLIALRRRICMPEACLVNLDLAGMVCFSAVAYFLACCLASHSTLGMLCQRRTGALRLQSVLVRAMVLTGFGRHCCRCRRSSCLQGHQQR